MYNETSVSYDHTSHSVDANDTSVILVTENSEFNASYVDVLKFGTYTNLLEASFWGFNAAVLIVGLPETRFLEELRTQVDIEHRYHRQMARQPTWTTSMLQFTMALLIFTHTAPVRW